MEHEAAAQVTRMCLLAVKGLYDSLSELLFRFCLSSYAWTKAISRLRGKIFWTFLYLQLFFQGSWWSCFKSEGAHVPVVTVRDRDAAWRPRSTNLKVCSARIANKSCDSNSGSSCSVCTLHMRSWTRPSQIFRNMEKWAGSPISCTGTYRKQMPYSCCQF